MDIKQLIHDDDAVSPVIGVILMVAITVILAAVIATFVLGLGDQVSSTAPQASFSTNYDSGSDNLEITHDGGDSIQQENLYLRGDTGTTGGDDIAGDNGRWDNLDDSTASGSNSEVVAGDRASPDVDSDFDVRLAFQSAEGDNSATLATAKGPDA